MANKHLEFVAKLKLHIDRIKAELYEREYTLFVDGTQMSFDDFIKKICSSKIETMVLTYPNRHYTYDHISAKSIYPNTDFDETEIHNDLETLIHRSKFLLDFDVDISAPN